MAEVVSVRQTLSDSIFKTRPVTHTFYRSDNNIGGTSITQLEEKRRQKQMRLPLTRGRSDVESFSRTATPEQFKQHYDEGDYRPPAPYRSFENFVDPVSGFLSAGGDVDRNTGHNRISLMVHLNDKPNAKDIREINSIRVGKPAAPPDTLRETVKDPGAPYPWNGRAMLDVSIRNGLGGWTSTKDPNENEKRAKTSEEAMRDKLSLRYRYTSSTQRSYEHVPWDQMLSLKKWKPTHTLELAADPIRQSAQKNRYESTANDWQRQDLRPWDSYQTRKGYYKQNEQIPGVVFCSQNPRANQIPGYSGSIGGENLEEIDNKQERFKPFTVKRVAIPRPSETAHRPNIPGYAGCTLYRPHSMPAHTTTGDDKTTARTHRPMPLAPHKPEFKRDGEMSKAITLVQPSNPFNLIKRQEPA